MAKSFKETIGDEFSDIKEILSGEMKLREREEKLAKLKEDAKKKQKAQKRKKIAQKEIVLEESDIPTKKVVQNIKLFEWEAPDRYKFNFESKTFWGILALVLVFILYLAILGQYYFMAAVVALVFLIYVAGTNNPVTVKHKITSRGIDTGNKLYEWFMLNSFWFSKKGDQYMLIVETKLRYPKALIMLFSESDKDAIFVLLQEKVLYKDIRKQSKLDRLTFGDYIPFDKV